MPYLTSIFLSQRLSALAASVIPAGLGRGKAIWGHACSQVRITWDCISLLSAQSAGLAVASFLASMPSKGGKHDQGRSWHRCRGITAWWPWMVSFAVSAYLRIISRRCVLNEAPVIHVSTPSSCSSNPTKHMRWSLSCLISKVHGCMIGLWGSFVAQYCSTDRICIFPQAYEGALPWILSST